MKSGIDKVIAAVINFLSTDSRIGTAPIGCFGVSFGGYLACRATALNPRISACITTGGFFDHRILAKLPPIAGVAVRKFFGLAAQEEFEKLMPYVDLAPLRGQMNAPLLIVHGTADHLVDMVQINEMQNWAGGPVETIILEGSEHVSCDRFNVCLPRMGDWMASKLFQEVSQKVVAGSN
jgi:dienelactone hydrolase